MARYKRHTVNKHYDYSHRHVWREHNGEIPKGLEIDHINNNPHDNRIENLQAITHKQNMQRKQNSVGYGYDKRFPKNPYQAQRSHNGKTVYIGMFGTPCGAKMAWNTFLINKGDKYAI